MLETRQTHKHTSKRFRNRLLNILSRVFSGKNFLPLIQWNFLGKMLFFLIFLGVLLTIFSPYFKLKKIEVLRHDPSTDITVIQEVLSDLIGKNMLFLTKQEVKTTLLKKFSSLNSIVVKEKWPDNLIVEVGISPAIFNILLEKTADHFSLSADGILLFKKASEGLPLIRLKNYEKPLRSGMILAEKSEMEALIKIYHYLQDDHHIPVKDIDWFFYAYEAHFFTLQGVGLWIDLRESIENQLEKLHHIEELCPFRRGEVKYVDLRIPKKVFCGR